MTAKIMVDDERRTHDESFVEGCWGTVAEQTDEAFLDDRSDADDDMEKGRIKFPTGKLYGRDGELKLLRGLYREIIEDSKSFKPTARVIFVGGYSGVGKSAAIAELVRQVKSDHHGKVIVGDNDDKIVSASGKYSKLRSAAAPFSAISESLGQLTAEILEPDREELLLKIRIELSEHWDAVRIMGTMFPVMVPLLFDDGDENPSKRGSAVATPNMNEVKLAFQFCMIRIFRCLDDAPFIWFLDDFQWCDDASLTLLEDILTSGELSNVLFIGSYRSNEVDEDHPFQRLMNDVESSAAHATTRMDLFGLSPDDIGEFIADTIGRDGAAEVSTLTEVVYARTLGNIFFVKQALEELVRKNALFYDMMTFAWEYNVGKVQLQNYLSEDVIQMIQCKIDEQPMDVKKLVVTMSFVPNNTDLPTLTALLRLEGVEAERVEKLANHAMKQGMIMRKSNSTGKDNHANFVFAHDKIREACFDSIPEGRPREELMTRISYVLIRLADNANNSEGESNKDWALFVAADHMNSVSHELVPRMELSRLNHRVGELNLAKGATVAANANFLAALACLEDTGEKWKGVVYQFTLQLLEKVIEVTFSVGQFEMSFSHIQDILENAVSLEDKFTAYLYRMKTLAEGENRDYAIGVVEGLKICDVYGIKFPDSPKKSDLMKESMQLKAALRGRPLTVLANLPMAEDSSMFLLLKELIVYANFSGNHDLVCLISDRSISLALQRGLSKDLMTILTIRAGFLARDTSKLKAANKFAAAAEQVLEPFREENKVLCAETNFRLTVTVFALLRPFRECVDGVLDAYRPLLHAGNSGTGLGSALAYLYMYLIAGLPLNSPLFEPKLIIFGEAARVLHRSTFEVCFNSQRQMVINLTKKKRNWTELKGDAFDEDAFLKTVDGNARSMGLRDTSMLRLVLAFIFWDEECMITMLENLSKFAKSDLSVARTCLRLCFIGLAGFEMGRKNKNKSQLELANVCLGYFKSLSKHGSPNAIPIYHFLKAMASPSRAAYDEAILQCKEARFYHLAAMASERCGVFLGAENHNDDASKQYIVAAYWLYHDWGALSKTNNLLEQYSFLKGATQGYRKAPSDASSIMRLANRVGKN